MKWIVAVYWIEAGHPWTPNDDPDEYRLFTADTEDEAIALAEERFGYEDEGESGPAYLAIPVRGRPTRVNVQVTRTVERVPV